MHLQIHAVQRLWWWRRWYAHLHAVCVVSHTQQQRSSIRRGLLIRRPGGLCSAFRKQPTHGASRPVPVKHECWIHRPRLWGGRATQNHIPFVCLRAPPLCEQLPTAANPAQGCVPDGRLRPTWGSAWRDGKGRRVASVYSWFHAALSRLPTTPAAHHPSTTSAHRCGSTLGQEARGVRRHGERRIRRIGARPSVCTALDGTSAIRP